MSTFAKLASALDKYRKKSQTIIVKRQQVKVENGAQAVIGNVNQGGGS